jgi:hypothetical protein
LTVISIDFCVGFELFAASEKNRQLLLDGQTPPTAPFSLISELTTTKRSSIIIHQTSVQNDKLLHHDVVSQKDPSRDPSEST